MAALKTGRSITARSRALSLAPGSLTGKTFTRIFENMRAAMK